MSPEVRVSHLGRSVTEATVRDLVQKGPSTASRVDEIGFGAENR